MTTKAKRGRKPRMPEPMRVLGDASLKALRKNNGVAPMLWELPRDDPGRPSGWFGCPYDKQDEDRWFALVVGIFGVRQEAVAHVFMNQLASLCDRHWEAPNGWHTDEVQMMQLLSIVQGMKPRNAAEAALAAQCCALHISAMKLGQHLGQQWGGDARTAASLSKIVRAYGDALSTMQRLKGQARKTKQVIRVERHTHTHQHIHLEGGEKIGGQPHGPDAGGTARLLAMPSQKQAGTALPSSSDEEKESLSKPRRQKSGSAKGGGERSLSARRLDQ